jgi:hypothetical protein
LSQSGPSWVRDCFPIRKGGSIRSTTIQFDTGHAGVTYVVVGVAVAVLGPVTALSIDEHRAVTFAIHPFNCSTSIKPSGLTGGPTRLPDRVEVAVSVLVGYPNGLSSPFAIMQLAQSSNWV